MGIGVVVVAGDRRKEHGEYLGKGTNNIAELTAIRRGLEIAAELLPGQDLAVRVYTDSSYAIGLLSQGWKAKANQELVADLREFLRGFPNLRMIKVEGHAGVPENERCDVLARQAVAQNRGRRGEMPTAVVPLDKTTGQIGSVGHGQAQSPARPPSSLPLPSVLLSQRTPGVRDGMPPSPPAPPSPEPPSPASPGGPSPVGHGAEFPPLPPAPVVAIPPAPPPPAAPGVKPPADMS
jgi:ribonuclease HI